MSPIDPSVSAGQNTGMSFFDCRGEDEHRQGGDGWEGRGGEGSRDQAVIGGGGSSSVSQPRRTKTKILGGTRAQPKKKRAGARAFHKKIGATACKKKEAAKASTYLAVVMG